MSSEKGWIKIYRDILEHWVYSDPLLLKLWITILCKANHEEKKILINNEIVVIHRGQFWTSIRKLAEETHLSRKTIENKTALLQNDGMIYMDARKGIGTLVTVHNYGKYQDFSDASGAGSGDTPEDTPEAKVETHRRPRSTHKQEDKNDKALFKNVKNNGLPPDDPDYFEEV